jgi:hypothetical protein
MLYSEKSGTDMKNVNTTFISAYDIWKEKVILDAIRSERKIKFRITRFFT